MARKIVYPAVLYDACDGWQSYICVEREVADEIAAETGVSADGFAALAFVGGRGIYRLDCKAGAFYYRAVRIGDGKWEMKDVEYNKATA